MKQKKGFKVRILFCIMLVVSMMCVSPRGARASQKQTNNTAVKIGFFNFDGYHMQTEKGLRDGYGYEFIQMVDRYTNWNLEYVGYDKSWDDMLNMLDKGEIDVLTSAQKTPDREKLFDFSSKPIGTSSAVLAVLAGDSRYAVGEENSYNGMRVGMLKGSSRNANFARLAKKKGFTYKAVYYNDTEQMIRDLHNKKNIDAIVTSSLRSMKNEQVLEQFNPSDFYAIVKKGNKKLLSQTNDAIEQMDINSPGWRMDLTNKFYSPQSDALLGFSKSELGYLSDLKKSGTKLRVITNPDLAPYSSMSKGKAKGIVPSIFKEIAKRVGIKYEYVNVSTYEEYNKMAETGNYDIDLTCFFNYSLAEKYNLGLTDSYLSTFMSKITLADAPSTGMKSVGIVKNGYNMTQYSEKLLEGKTYREYKTREDCANAILDKKVDGMYVYAYTAQMLAATDARNRLLVTVLPDYSVNMALGVKRTNNGSLLTILNKGVNSVKSTVVPKIINHQTTDIDKNNSIMALIYDNMWLSIGIIVATLVLVFGIVILLLRLRSVREQEKQALKLERFMTYVCESNVMVAEVNLVSMQGNWHRVKDGKLITESRPYKFVEFYNKDEYIHPGDFTKITEKLDKKKMRQMLQDGGQTYFEARTKDSTGKYRWYGFTLRAIPRDNDHPKNFIIFKKDIEEVKRQEEEYKKVLQDALETAKDASTAKGRFLSKMSHEIRTPLNAIIGYLDIAKDSQDNREKVTHCVDNSVLAARHLLNIINDVLDMSAIESGKMKIAKEEFDLKRQITTLTTIFFSQAKAKDIDFKVELNELTQEWVVGDGLRVNQVLMNLLSNAIKFTDSKGHVTLKVTEADLFEKQVYIKFEVMDDGIGMSEEYRQKLFTPFEQEKATTASRYGGSGLGLSITKNLITMMGGSISLESKQGEGSHFTVLLHFERSSRKPVIDVAKQDYSHLRALVVDDEESSCEYIHKLLDRCGMKSDTVTSGEAAVKQIKRRLGSDYSYDICIMDWNMPGMNGVETTRKIHEECDSSIPVIIATGYDITEFEDVAKENGVTKVIAKPLFQSSLFDLLISIFGKYKPEPEKKKTKHFDNMHILLAEDNVMNQEIAVEILTKAGCKVDTADDGNQAYKMFLEAEPGTYQAILMDIQMPVMDGYDATKAIRSSKHSEAKTIPIIAMTANAFAEDVSQALACGMNDHVAKPINYDKLFDIVSKYGN